MFKFSDPTFTAEEREQFFSQGPSHKKLKETFFQSEAINIGRHEGQRVENKVVILGTRVGPESNSIEALVHEMSHLLEIDNKRMTKPGWGFKYGKKIQVMGQIFHEPLTYQASLRECRTFAIEMMIYDLIGYEYDPESIIRALKYMNDYINVPGKVDQAKLDFLMKETLKVKNSLTSESLCQLWLEKNQYLKKKINRKS